MRRAACLAALVLGCVWGCGDDDGGASVESVTLRVGPEGGTVELASGGKVTIPVGALSVETDIKITKLEPGDVAALPSNLEAAGKPYAFEPHGISFAQPVKIEVPYEGDAEDVRPVKLDDEQDTSWQTLVGSEKDEATKQLAIDVTSFSVIWAARPRRGSGVITLPDGAIVEDAGMSGEGGTGGGAGAGSGGTGGSAGSAGAGTGGTGGGTGGTGGIASCAGMPVVLAGIDPVGDIYVSGDNVFVASGGNLINHYTASGTSLSLVGPLMTFEAPEVIESVSVTGDVVAVGTSRGGVSTAGRLHIATDNGADGFAFNLFDFASYSEYWSAAAPPGPVAFNPSFGRIVTDGVLIAAEERAAGSLVMFSAETSEPSGYLTTAELDTSPLSGVVAMHLTNNGILVAAISRSGIGLTTVNAIRTYDVSNPANMTLIDEYVRTGARPYAMIYDAVRDRYLVSNLGGGEISEFRLNQNGEISTETVLADVRSGSQARGLAVLENLLVVGNPDFNVQPPDSAVSVFEIGPEGSLTFNGLVDLPDVAGSDESYSIQASRTLLYVSGTAAHVVDLSECIVL